MHIPKRNRLTNVDHVVAGGRVTPEPPQPARDSWAHVVFCFAAAACAAGMLLSLIVAAGAGVLGYEWLVERGLYTMLFLFFTGLACMVGANLTGRDRSSMIP